MARLDRGRAPRHWLCRTAGDRRASAFVRARRHGRHAARAHGRQGLARSAAERLPAAADAPVLDACASRTRAPGAAQHRRPVLPGAERRDRPLPAAHPARCGRARRARARAHRRSLHRRRRRAAVRPGRPCERGGAPVQPVPGRARPPRHATRGVDIRLRPHPSPHAQQALRRRQRDGRGRRAQHRQRILPARRRIELHRHRYAGHRRGGPEALFAFRRLLEQPVRVSRAVAGGRRRLPAPSCASVSSR